MALNGQSNCARICPLLDDSVEKVESSAALQNCRIDFDIFDQLELPLQFHLELATFVRQQKMRSPAFAF
jgi:hypothetical protein